MVATDRVLHDASGMVSHCLALMWVMTESLRLG